EIRTPINAILNAANLIKEETHGYMNSEVKEFFPVIDSASKRIIRTIDSILNMSELQIGSYAPQYKRVNVEKEIIQKLFFEFKSLTISKGFRFDVITETEDVSITADVYSMEQIFTNLIDNAIKYTEKGSIEIRIYRNRQYKLCIDVKDTGIGISKEFLPQLFEPFRQEQQGYTRRFEGNGLGLALVKNYCKINNALITVQSEKDLGTTFTVTFAEEQI
ncbi:MAG: HAMP domain-containing histidine kinase, partial [Melioribacteraceae bacterium]